MNYRIKLSNREKQYSKIFIYLNFETTNVPATRTAENIAADVSMSLVLEPSEGSTTATPVLLLFFLLGADSFSSSSFSSSLKIKKVLENAFLLYHYDFLLY